MSLDPDDIGLDLSKKHPTCDVCRKESDGAKMVLNEPLPQLRISGYCCGTHYDVWLVSEEWRSAFHGAFGADTAYIAFVNRLRGARYAACWRIP